MLISTRLPGWFALSLALVLSGCASFHSMPPNQSLGLDMLRRPTSGALLYSSSAYYNTVTIYTFPQGQEVTSFSGAGPQGLCSDQQGDVFMAEPYEKVVEEYAHGATYPMRAFNYPGDPYGCAVDNTSTYLAVTSAGSVGVFDLSSSGSPTTYTYPGIQIFFFCTYDSQGNLFVDGTGGSGTTLLFELPKGKSALKLVKLRAKIPYSGTVQWDGQYLAIYVLRGLKSGEVLRVAVNKYRATIKQRVLLKGPRPYTSELWIQGGLLVEPEDRSANLALWNYPAGGKPTLIIPNAGYPFGVTVSVGAKR